MIGGDSMTLEEKRYHDTVNRIAFSLLVFYGAFNLYSVIMNLVVPLFTDDMSAVAGRVTYELIYGVLYAAVFVLPAFFYYCISKNASPAPLDATFTLPHETPLYIFVGLSIISAAGYLNSLLLNVFDYGTFTDEILFESDITLNYQVVLMMFTLAIVPGFVEELLFRGVILNNLLPFGRTTAVFASAVLFGIMHQNAGQFLYATVAGLVFGYIYVYTRSLWCCVLMHLCNNFLSLVHTVLLERLPEHGAMPILFGIELAVFLLGIAAAVYLILHKSEDRTKVLQSGVFEVEPAPDAEYAEVAIPMARRVRLFFSAPMIVFLALCAAQMGILVLYSLVL